MKSSILGRSVNGLPIWGFHFGTASTSRCDVLILCATHGDETESVVATEGLLSTFQENFPYRLNMTIIPALNVDGVLAKTRLNANGVDLNRNLPTNDWTKQAANPRYQPGPYACSEPENKALVSYLDTYKPKLILSLHSWQPCLNVNGNCRAIADQLSAWTNYPVVESIGYPTPGCLGTYAGLEREMPTITYEIERGLSTRSILEIHVPAIAEALKVTEQHRRETPL